MSKETKQIGRNAGPKFVMLSWTDGWDEPLRGWDVSWGTADGGHGRYTWIDSGNYKFSTYNLSSSGGAFPPEPIDYYEAKSGECLGEFKSKSEAVRAAERHHWSQPR